MKTSYLWFAVLVLPGLVLAESVFNESVVLLHGLARTSRSMNRMEASLTRAGYSVHLVDYPSTKKTVEKLSREHLGPAVDECQQAQPDKIHFVAHSIGNIVLRHYLGENSITNIGRIVMLGPPNKGSEVVDRIGHMTLFQWINGPAGQELGTASDSLPNTLAVPAADVGVIAGTRSINWILSAYIPGPDDGKVSPESAKIEGMDDFATIPTSHPFLMRNPKAIAMTICFLQHARFEASTPNKKVEATGTDVTGSVEISDP